MAKTLLVQADKEFRITVPDDAKITFGPWSPPKVSNGDVYNNRYERAAGTLRIYQGTKDNIIACFSGVTGFRDLSMEYAEKVAVEEGDTMWKSDSQGYVRESKVQRREEWTEPVRQLPAKPRKGRKSARDDF